MIEKIKSYCNYIKLGFDILLEIWPDLLFKVAGNLFPFYIGAFILLLVDKASITKVFDPQSFILYGSTFLFSSIYLWFKTLEQKEKSNKGLLVLLLFILLAIVISFLYALSYTDKLENGFDFKGWAYYLFFVSIIIYIIFECINYYRTENADFRKSSKKDFDDLSDSFGKIKDDE